MTDSLLQNLPGVSLPVSAVSSRLREMWDRPGGGTGLAPSEFRASQMNLVILLGDSTSPAQAAQVFETAVTFAQRYPSRIIVLTPEAHLPGESPLEAKLYAQCFVGKSYREMCCCEGLLLGYQPGNETFVENQVSIWIETDLPVALWAHQFPVERLPLSFPNLLQSARRVVYDSAAQPLSAAPPEDGADRSSWVDLAFARTLPIRQSLGSLLSRFAPDLLFRGATALEVGFRPEHAAEAASLTRWFRQALTACRQAEKPSAVPQPIPIHTAPADSSPPLDADYAFAWESSEGLSFSLKVDFGKGKLQVSTRLGETREAVTLPAQPLSPAAALSEAVFF
ncbi:MAG: glucose-6-phosphate dehydrogenase assembly protein OpcA [Puniceicoccaceae bacterium]